MTGEEKKKELAERKAKEIVKEVVWEQRGERKVCQYCGEAWARVDHDCEDERGQQLKKDMAAAILEGEQPDDIARRFAVEENVVERVMGSARRHIFCIDMETLRFRGDLGAYHGPHDGMVACGLEDARNWSIGKMALADYCFDSEEWEHREKLKKRMRTCEEKADVRGALTMEVELARRVAEGRKRYEETVEQQWRKRVIGLREEAERRQRELEEINQAIEEGKKAEQEMQSRLKAMRKELKEKEERLARIRRETVAVEAGAFEVRKRARRDEERASEARTELESVLLKVGEARVRAAPPQEQSSK